MKEAAEGDEYSHPFIHFGRSAILLARSFTRDQIIRLGIEVLTSTQNLESAGQLLEGRGGGH